MLAQQILKGIDDAHPLAPLICSPSPLGDLIAGYSKQAAANSSLPAVTPETTGAEFKAALEQVDPEELVAMLSKYSTATKSLMTPTVYAEDPEKRDNRRQRHWMIRASFIVVSSLLFIVVGATMAVAYRSGIIDNALVQTLMSSVTEILKISIGLQSK